MKKAAILSILLFIFGFSTAQVELPKSFSQEFQSRYSPNDIPAAKPISFRKDQMAKHRQKYDGSPITSYPIPLNLNPDNAGKWFSLPGGGRLWQLRLVLQDAKSTAVFFQKVQLPAGAYLHLYDKEKQAIKGPFFRPHISTEKRLFSGIIPNNEIVIEYFEPWYAKEKGYFELFRMDHVYGVASNNGDPRYATSKDCHTNINCEAGADWQEEKLGICRIVMVLEEGIGYCTGNLMNNTAQDQRPFILTGFHCQDGFTPLYDLWRFDFNFESPGCGNENLSPSFQSMSGCTQRAGSRDNDMLLLELLASIPSSYRVYFLGWDRTANGPNMSFNIHHPLGDVKKITHFYRPATILSSPINWNNDVQTPANHHFSVRFNDGTFESGSSGSALFNMDGRVVGHLHGGDASCESTLGYFSRFSMSWTGGEAQENRLSDWLDPLGTEATTLDGLTPAYNTGGTISGYVQTSDGRGIPGVTVQLVGIIGSSTVTNSDGAFIFNNVPFANNYEIVLAKTGNIRNGLSLGDLVASQRHVLRAAPLDNPYKIIAADADGSRFISLADIVELQRIILGIQPDFRNIPIWQFMPADYKFPDPKDPFSEELPQFFVIENLKFDLFDVNFIGIKSGDTTGDVQIE